MKTETKELEKTESTAIMKKLEKPVMFETESGPVELAINQVKHFIAKGSSEVTIAEAVEFIQLCKYNALNPYIGDAFLIKFGKTATMVTSKYAYMKRAERAGDRYEGFKAGVILLPKGWEEKFTVDGNPPEPIYREGTLTLGMDLIGGWAEVFKKGAKFPIRAELDFNEYVGRKSDGAVNSQWTTKPATMIRKCSLVGALREAFPDVFGGLVSEEELPEVPTGSQPRITDNELDQDKLVDLEKEGDPKDDGDIRTPVRRARRHAIEIDGQPFKTCGIGPIHIKSIKNAEKKDPKLTRVIDDYLKAIGANDVTFLRQPEGDELVKMLTAQLNASEDMDGDLVDAEFEEEGKQEAPGEAEEKANGDAPESEKQESLIDSEDQETEEKAPLTLPDDEKVPCPDRGDIEVEFAFCKEQCPKYDEKTCIHFS